MTRDAAWPPVLRLPRRRSCLWALLLVVPAAAFAQSREEAAAVCATPREGNESPAAWVKRATGLPFFKGAELESTPLEARPDFLRKRAETRCPLADAWEWAVILGQPLEPSGDGYVVRFEDLVGGPLTARFELVKKNAPGKPGRIVTAPCTHPLVPAAVEYACFDVELPAPPEGDWREGLSGRKLKLVDAWPAGRPHEAEGTAAMKAFCERLARAQRKGAPFARALKQAGTAQWPIDALLREADATPELARATAEKFGVRCGAR